MTSIEAKQLLRTKHQGFKGVIKFLAEDFHVREIDPSGKILQLNELFSRRQIAQGLRELRKVEEGESFIDEEFELDDEQTRVLQEEGCMTLEDVQTLQLFIRQLAHVQKQVDDVIKEAAAKDLSELKDSAKDMINLAEFIGGVVPTGSSPTTAGDTTPVAEGSSVGGSDGAVREEGCVPSSVLASDLDVTSVRYRKGLLERHPELVAELTRVSASRSIQFTNPPHCLLVGDLERAREKVDALILEGVLNPDEFEKLDDLHKTKFLEKTMRKSMHEVIRSCLPPLTSSTMTTGEAFLSQCEVNQASVENLVDENGEPIILNDELRDAVELKRVFFPGVMKRKFKGFSIPELKALYTQTGRSLTDDSKNDDEDALRFVRVFTKPLCFSRIFPHVPKTTTTAATDDVDSKPQLGGRGNTPLQNQIQRITNAFVPWPADRPHYCHFLLWKMNRETTEAITKIALSLGVSHKAFSFAGSKDKRAITVQRVSVQKVSREDMLRATLSQNWDNQVRVGCFEYKPKRLQLGSLLGNHFKIVIRGVDPSQFAVVETACKELADRDGRFINYFGTQRFGTTAIGTHVVGGALLREQWERAVRLILGDTRLIEDENNRKRPRTEVPEEDENRKRTKTESNDHDKKAEESIMAESSSTNETEQSCGFSEDRKGVTPLCDASAAWKNSAAYKETMATTSYRRDNPCDPYLEAGDIDGALKNLNPRAYLEKLILTALKQEKRGFLPALIKLPRNSLSMYLHAAQSLVWNYVASERIVRFGGAEPVVGDLVCVKESPDAQLSENEGDESDDGVNDKHLKKSKSSRQVVSLSDESMLLNYKIDDVVLPLPGKDVEYPTNMIGVYEEAAQKFFDLSIKDFKVDGKYGIGELSGFYRPLIARAANLVWRIVPAEEFEGNSEKPLLASDVDRLFGRAIAKEDSFTDQLSMLEVQMAMAGSTATPDTKNGNDLLIGVSDVKSEVAATPLATCANPLVSGGSSIAGAPVEGSNLLPEFAGKGAVLLSCSLPKSSYLTVALRELMDEESIIQMGKKSPSTMAQKKARLSTNRRERGGGGERGAGRGGRDRGRGGGNSRGGNRGGSRRGGRGGRN